MTTRPNLEIDDTPPAPGELELVRRFISVHDHEPGVEGSLPPTADTVEWTLRDMGLLRGRASDEELRWASEVLEALRRSIGVAAPPAEAAEVLDDAARRCDLEPRFDTGELLPRAGGVAGAVGRILGVAFLAQRDGRWERFKECSSPLCRAVFFDRSKNGSGRWCVMSSCGNRAKVRAYRERQKAEA